ncbi:MAG: ATP-dependent DNA helicase [Actinomycetia bacterium]|nr:ATP-dependent DNA helicase [Actinomycetes bacterium]
MAVDVLDDVLDATGGQHRPGQVDMAAWVAQAISDGHHLLCEAGTGIGKSFGYLIPAITSHKRVVIATSTKTLQDQIAADLPRILAVAGVEGHTPRTAIIKGRASYVCPAKAADYDVQLTLGGTSESDIDDRVGVLINWWRDGGDGQRDHAPVEVTNAQWGTISTSGMECPATRCSYKNDCPAMEALDAAREAEIIICNHHLYGADISSEGSVLGAHDAVVFDEAHRLEDALCSSVGITLTPRRVAIFISQANTLLKRIDMDTSQRTSLTSDLWKRAKEFEGWMASNIGNVDLPLHGSWYTSARKLSDTVRAVSDAIVEITKQPGATFELAVIGHGERTLNLAGHLVGDLAVLTSDDGSSNGHVCWIDPGPNLRTSPISISGSFSDRAATVTTICTSATLTVDGSFEPLTRALGYGVEVSDMSEPYEDEEPSDPLRYMSLRVGSPFDYPSQAGLYLPQLPDPSDPGWGDAVADLTNDLVARAGGRALILCTSNAAVARIADKLSEHQQSSLGDGHQILVQGAVPRQKLLDTFRTEATSVLVATMGFWEGVDIVGDACQIVILDRIPFPRPDDPLWQARRQAAADDGYPPFFAVDLPRAANLTAQGAGRLIRTHTDRGLIVLCDSRIRTRSYGRTIINTLPEMPILTTIDEAGAYLDQL